MQLEIISPGLRSLGKKGILCLMVGFWLAVTAFSLFPQLHRLLHQDSGSLNHECLLTLVSKSLLVLGVADGAALPAPALEFHSCFRWKSFSPAAVSDRFAPCRAPPSGPLFTSGC